MQILGLQARPELNGRIGRALRLTADGQRWEVQLDGAPPSATLSVRAAHLNMLATGAAKGAPPPRGSKFRIEEVKGSGLGAIAVEALYPGEQLLAEKPLFRISAPEMVAARAAGRKAQEAMISDRLARASVADQAAFWALSDCHSGKEGRTAFGVWQTNAIATGVDAAETENGLYLIGSRINHSCKPNVNRCWIPELGAEVFHAIQEIEPGEQLTIYYVDPTATHDERQKLLWQSFSFRCRCNLCSLEGAHRRACDEVRREYRELDRELDRAIRQPKDFQSAFEMLWRVIKILETEFDGDPHLMQKAFYDGFLLSALAGETVGATPDDDDTAGPSDWMDMAIKAKVLAEGDHDGVSLLRRWAAEPWQHPLVAQARGTEDAGFPRDDGDDDEWMLCQPCGPDPGLGSLAEGSAPGESKHAGPAQQAVALDLAALD